MSLMEKETRHKQIIWAKRVLGTAAFFMWIYIIYSVMQMPAPFIEQAPYCMAGTMLIFGILTGIFKGLDYLLMHRKED